MKKIHLILLITICLSFSAFSNPVKTDTITLENKFLKVKISTLGAEIISIYNKKEQFEHIWKGEKASWNQHAPILFPVVGKLKNKQYQLNGKTYKMKNHGFASYSPFTIIKKSNSKVVLQLKSNSETLKQYPFDFALTVTYKLCGKKLSINNTVENKSTNEMLFSIGAHPGFNVPFHKNATYNDCYLAFNKTENATRLPLTKKGYLSHQKIKGFVKGKKLPISHQLFKDRVVILDDLKSNTITIKSDYSTFGIQIGVKNFDYVGVWTSHKKDAPFVCIEPWYGITDYEDTTGQIKNKKSIQKLASGNKFAMKYYIKSINFKK